MTVPVSVVLACPHCGNTDLSLLRLCLPMTGHDEHRIVRVDPPASGSEMGCMWIHPDPIEDDERTVDTARDRWIRCVGCGHDFDRPTELDYEWEQL